MHSSAAVGRGLSAISMPSLDAAISMISLMVPLGMSSSTRMSSLFCLSDLGVVTAAGVGAPSFSLFCLRDIGVVTAAGVGAPLFGRCGFFLPPRAMARMRKTPPTPPIMAPAHVAAPQSLPRLHGLGDEGGEGGSVGGDGGEGGSGGGGGGQTATPEDSSTGTDPMEAMLMALIPWQPMA